jgi:hypothetical protein
VIRKTPLCLRLSQCANSLDLPAPPCITQYRTIKAPASSNRIISIAHLPQDAFRNSFYYLRPYLLPLHSSSSTSTSRSGHLTSSSKHPAHNEHPVQQVLPDNMHEQRRTRPHLRAGPVYQAPGRRSRHYGLSERFPWAV